VEKGERERKILTPKAKAEWEERKRQRQSEAAETGNSGAEPGDKLARRQIKVPGGKAESGPVPALGRPFEERYRRVTTYLERGLHARVQSLRESGRVASVTALYNAALSQYVNKYYGEEEEGE